MFLPKRSYTFKIETHTEVEQGIQILSSITSNAANELLKQNWTIEWITQLGASPLKAYKIIGEHQVQLVTEGRLLYLPSRIRRGIAEWVGRTLRSHYKKLNCFLHVRDVLQLIDLQGNLNIIVKQVSLSIYLQFGVWYRHQLIRQILRMLRYWSLNHHVDIYTIPYTTLIRPTLINFIFPYAVDDDQAIKIIASRKEIKVKMKLPKTDLMYSRTDWHWVQFTVKIPEKIQKRLLKSSTIHPNKPDLRFKKLKSGLVIPILQFSWDFNKEKLNYVFYKKKRVLAVDLGLVNLTTSVICEAGLQITPPHFYKRTGNFIQRIEHRYTLLSNIQKKKDRLPIHAPGQRKRENEVSRIHAKLTRIRKQEVSLLTKHLLELAQQYGCSSIVLEDLRAIQPLKNRKKWSRRLSNWFHGLLAHTLSYKAELIGIALKFVNPRGTSSYCPRCGCQGQKIENPSTKKVNTLGRAFYCQNCLFVGDRDYVGSLNVYRLYESYSRKNYSLSSSRPVLYQSNRHPLNRSSGNSLC